VSCVVVWGRLVEPRQSANLALTSSLPKRLQRIELPVGERHTHDSFRDTALQVVVTVAVLTLAGFGSSRLNRGKVRLSRKWGTSHTLPRNAPPQPQEDGHGPHNRILPQSGVPCQRPNRPGPYWYSFADGTALHLPRVRQTLHRHHRYGLLSAAHLGRNRHPHRDLAGPWLPRASPCGGVWLRRAHCRGLVGPLGPSGPSRTRVSG